MEIPSNDATRYVCVPACTSFRAYYEPQHQHWRSIIQTSRDALRETWFSSFQGTRWRIRGIWRFSDWSEYLFFGEITGIFCNESNLFFSLLSCQNGLEMDGAGGPNHVERNEAVVSFNSACAMYFFPENVCSLYLSRVFMLLMCAFSLNFFFVLSISFF